MSATPDPAKHMMQRGGKHSAGMRALIAERTKAALADPDTKARLRKGVQKSWTPERRAKQRERFLALKDRINDVGGPNNFETRRLENLRTAQAVMPLRQMMAHARQSPGHRFAVLPDMTAPERNKYRYWRNTIGREFALSVVMSEREARGG